MTTLVRRHHLRATLRIVAYMEIEPGVGAIILNVSEDGLCFQSVAPLGTDRVINFSFKEDKRHMAGSGELAWLDGRGKCGGVRFTSLSPEAREQVNRWLSESPPEESDASDGQFIKKRRPATLARFTPAPSRLRLAIRGGGFSSGLIAGLLISILTTSLVLLAYSYYGQLAEAFVGSNARFRRHAELTPGANSLNEVLPATRDALATQAASAVASPSEQDSQLSTPAKTAEPKISMAAQDLQQVTTAWQPNPPGSPEKQAAVKPAPAPRPLPASAPERHLLAFAPVPPVFARPTVSPLPRLTLSGASAVSQPTTVASMAVPGATLQMYFDLGRFNDEAVARRLKEKVGQLGLRTTVLKSRLLWRTSYQVLVGPYDSEEEEGSIRSALIARGYDPRPLERGSRRFLLRSRLNLNGAPLPLGETFTISWESHVENATVRFTKNDDVLATARGKWVEQAQKYSKDEYVYTGKSRKTLVEVHFSGLKRALVLGE